ncbi:MAG: hypothetical protein HY761_10240, partial [Candidatus Omnitrophica bacterium]|nr:hypothetical protein [Candidatus Omnitrophota bacterium]
DAATGQYYAKARYFTTQLGRWSQPEPLLKGVPPRGFLRNPQKLNPYVYCNNNPLIFTDPDGKNPYKTYNSLTPGERELVKKYPFAALKVNQAKEQAFKSAGNLFGGLGGEGYKGDAYRHSLWNYLMTKSVGHDLAKQFATAHEQYQQQGSPEAKAKSDQDLFNNAVGRNLAEQNANNATNAESIVLKAVNAGVTQNDWNVPQGPPQAEPDKRPYQEEQEAAAAQQAEQQPKEQNNE